MADGRTGQGPFGSSGKLSRFLSAPTRTFLLALTLSSIPALANAAGPLLAVATEQTMNHGSEKTCRVNTLCDPNFVDVNSGLEKIVPPEQIVNRIEQTGSTAPVNVEPVIIEADTEAATQALSEALEEVKAKDARRPKSEQTMNRAAILDPYGVGTPFAISVDGETVSGSAIPNDDNKTDRGLAAADIQVKYDGLDATPVLNASHVTQEGDGSVRFLGHLNYPDFVQKAEFRVYHTKGGVLGDLVDVIEADQSFAATWTGEQSDEDKVYVFRVYDAKGRFDETQLIELKRSTAARGDGLISGPNADKDNSALRNIPVHGGAVTVFGRNIPEGYHVKVLGEEIRTDRQNSFVTQKILPPGDHEVDVAVYGIKDDGLSFSREVNIPDNDWFYVGLADLTVGHKLKGLIEDADTGDFDRTYTKGRLAFYLKGKIKGKYLLTAAADTGEGAIEDMFTGWDKKDPRYILKGLDPDDYYPVYGDDSSIVEDAPTKGKFYVRLARGNSHVMWGNFKTNITGTTFAAQARALYGAGAHFQSEGVTSFGEPKTRIDAYAAQPGTTPQRDNFKGTGGSAYFLKRQQITSGSEQVTVEIRDPLTGRVVSTRTLKAGEDYEIDYVQGVIILRSPLSSTAGATSAVSSGTLGSNTQHLVVNYEFSPAFGAADGEIYGARASQWFGDHVQIGATASKDSTGSSDNEMLEADIKLRMSENTYFQAEIAQSRGRGIGSSSSTDGGLTFNEELPVGSRSKTARAYRVKAVADLGELANDRINGYGEVYYELREKNFSALDSETAFEKRIYGGSLRLDVNENIEAHLALKAIEEGTASGKDTQLYEAVVEATAEITENITLLAGVTWSDYRDPATAGRNGTRTDIGARITYAFNDTTNVFVFGQTTAHLKGDRVRNDRIGVGAEFELTDRLSITGDISTGTSGIGGSAELTYESSPDNKSWLGYRLDPDRDEVWNKGTAIQGSDSGVIVAGSRRKMNEWLSAFTESTADLYGKKRSLSQTYGITFQPDEVWSASLGMELGTVTDALNGDFDRKAFSAKAGYQTEKVSASATFEARFEDSEDNKRDRNTYLFRANTSYKASEDWRVLAHLDALISDSDQATILDGDYVEGSIGFAYRPVTNDRLNILGKYTFLYDLPGPQQVNSTGDLLGPAQRSHVFSLDASYDINEYLTIGAKYGYRYGEVSLSRDNDEFTRSTAHLGILRADVNIVKNWDALAEGRVLYSPEAGQTDWGALVAVYRHLGNNAKIGIGYNFGRFSDDLTDLTKDDEGVFLNVIGKF